MGTLLRPVSITTERPPVGHPTTRRRFEGVIDHGADGVCLDCGNDVRVCFDRETWHLWDCDPPGGLRMAVTFAVWMDRICVERVETVR